MRFLFFVNTPAHAHLYKYAVERLDRRGHDVHILARDYGCTLDLLEWHDLPYSVYGRCDTTKGSLFRQLPRHYASLLPATLRYDPDLIFGMGGYAAPAGLVSRTPVVLILDSEPTTLDHALSKPLADAVLTPAAFRKDLGPKHYVFDGFKESAYLHPDVHEPYPAIRSELGVSAQEPFAILRFNAFGSHHDVGAGGFSPAQRRRLVSRLAEEVTVFVSDEGGQMDLDGLPAKRFDVHPAALHHALAEADLLVADTQTIATEAALLGTPAIRSNSFVGDDDMGNFLELERQGLLRNLDSFEAVLSTATELLNDESTATEWARRRDEFVADMVNLTDVIVAVATKHDSIETVPGLRSRSAARPTRHTAQQPPTARERTPSGED
ncbi:hypothetical protein [Haloarcula pelagica]|uniref:hypothetical protein n=1 Tax=Haloarcula pelagica TaxID=3033389 RepID=UPI0024C3B699|nr:hypothetical protein [Halomicroarcula sp. YJ-61-S]